MILQSFLFNLYLVKYSFIHSFICPKSLYIHTYFPHLVWLNQWHKKENIDSVILTNNFFFFKFDHLRNFDLNKNFSNQIWNKTSQSPQIKLQNVMPRNIAIWCKTNSNHAYIFRNGVLRNSWWYWFNVNILT